MILHTVCSYNEIFAGEFQVEEEPLEFSEQQVKNGIVVSGSRDGKNYVNRLISTDPKAYLDKKYAPGTEI